MTAYLPPAKGGLWRRSSSSAARSWHPRRPDDAALDAVANPYPQDNYVARFTAPEFTCLCPVTGQPDFAHFVIDYVPARSLVESKSLKLFLGSFRNHAAFHEATTLLIGKRIVTAIKPRYLRIAGYWYPARRHPHRRLLADGKTAERCVAAGHRRGGVSGTRLRNAPSFEARYARTSG